MNSRKAKTLATLLLAVPLSGCGSSAQSAPPPPAAPNAPIPAASRAEADPPIATVRGEAISREEVVQPLLDAYGLNFLLLTVQFKIARQEAAKAGITLKPEDVDAERNMTMKGLFPESEPKDYPELINQLLVKQGITRPQFELIISTNTALRKIAEPTAEGVITDANIQQAFNMKFGAKVQIRDIKLADLASAQKARQRLTAGQAFESVAAMMSIDETTRPNGGLWPPISPLSTDISQAIKDQAFGLKEGEVSDVINTDGAFHIIRVEKKISPPVKIVQLDAEMHDKLKKELTEKLVQQKVKILRGTIAAEVASSDILQINEPVLKKQFDQQLEEAKRAQEEQKKANMQDMIRRLNPASQPTTFPASEAPNRPPATQPGR